MKIVALVMFIMFGVLLTGCAYNKPTLDVMFLAQSSNESQNCGQACLAMCVSFLLDVDVSPSLVRKQNDWLASNYQEKRYLGSQGYQTDIQKLSVLAREYWGIESRPAYSSIEEVQKELQAERPVIVAVQPNMSSTPRKVGHFMILLRMDEQCVWVNDPGKNKGGGNKYPIDVFIESWQTQSNACVMFKNKNGAD